MQYRMNTPFHPPYGQYPFPPPIQQASTFSLPYAAQYNSKGSFLTNLFQKGGEIDLGTILNNTQKIVGLTQQTIPLIQQYGPIIRSVPAIWKIMRTPDVLSDSVLTTFSEKQIDQVSRLDGLPSPKLYV